MKSVFRMIVCLSFLGPLAPPSTIFAADFEPGITLIDTAGLKAARDAGEKMVLINTLSPIEYRDKAIPGSVNIPYEYLRDRKASLPEDRDAMLVFYCLSAKSPIAPRTARLAVEKGYRNVRLYQEGISEWAKAGYPTDSIEPVSRERVELLTPAQMKEAAADQEGTIVLDIRDNDLYDAVKFPFKNVLHIEMAYLRNELPSIPRNRKIIVACHTGKQSMLAAPYLKSKGLNVVGCLDGGIMAWQKAGEPVAK